MDGTRAAWRLHWSQRLSLFSLPLTLRRSSLVCIVLIDWFCSDKVADTAHGHWAGHRGGTGFMVARTKAYCPYSVQ
jgi:hypothetical protein